MANRGSDELLRALGVAVRQCRTEQGMTQERLAEEAKLHTTYVSDVENGKRNIGIINVDRLARALSTDLAELIRLAQAERRR